MAQTDLFMAATVMLVVGTSGFFIKMWIDSLKASFAELNTTLRDLQRTVNHLDKKRELSEYQLKEQGKEIVELQTRVCPTPDCPFQAAQGVMHRREHHRRFDDTQPGIEA